MTFNVALFSIEENDYRFNFLYMSKDEAINSLKNADLSDRSGTL